MEKIYNIKLVQRYDTEENWIKNNIILKKGEVGYVIDGNHAGLYKLGDGTSTWTELKYAITQETLKVKVVTANTTLTANHKSNVLLVNGTQDITISIPTIANEFYCTIKNISSNKVSIAPVSTNIDGSATNIQLNENEFVQIVQYNNNYFIINTNKIYTSALGELTIEDAIVSATEITV